MAILKFPYGRSYVALDIPRKNLLSVVESKITPSAEDEGEEVGRAIKNPIASPSLNNLVHKGDKIAILVSDITRAIPDNIVAPHVIKTLKEAGVTYDDMEILIANGLHRPASRREMEELLGKEVLEKVAVINHRCKNDENLIDLGKTSFGTNVILNLRAVNADFIVSTGLIEPHFFAGYSGGRKIVMPGIAGKKSVFQNHSYEMIAHPNSRYGILDGNVIYQDGVEAAKIAKLGFIVNVIVNKEHRIAKAFAGDFMKAYRAGVHFLSKFVNIPVSQRVDIVITSNGGYPLDRNVYQTVKGMATAELIVKKGGVIVVMAECLDGLIHKDFFDLLVSVKSSDELLKKIRENEPLNDQWQAQFLAWILNNAEVILMTKGVKHSYIEDMMMMPASTPEEALELALKMTGKEAKIAAIPEGPFIIPTLE